MPKPLPGSPDLDRAAAALMASVRGTWAPEVKPWDEALEVHRELARKNVADVLRAVRDNIQAGDRVTNAAYDAIPDGEDTVNYAAVFAVMIDAILGEKADA